MEGWEFADGHPSESTQYSLQRQFFYRVTGQPSHQSVLLLTTGFPRPTSHTSQGSWLARRVPRLDHRDVGQTRPTKISQDSASPGTIAAANGPRLERDLAAEVFRNRDDMAQNHFQ